MIINTCYSLWYSLCWYIFQVLSNTKAYFSSFSKTKHSINTKGRYSLRKLKGPWHCGKSEIIRKCPQNMCATCLSLMLPSAPCWNLSTEMAHFLNLQGLVSEYLALYSMLQGIWSVVSYYSKNSGSKWEKNFRWKSSCHCTRFE